MAAALRVPAAKLQDGGLYHILARNSSAGIYCLRTRSFEIARSKLGRNFLCREFDWDIGPPHGTALPLEMIEVAPTFADARAKFEYLLLWRGFLSTPEDDWE